MSVQLDRQTIQDLIHREPSAVVLGLLEARKTGKLVVKSSELGTVTLQAVTLKNVNGKVQEFPINCVSTTE